MSAERWNRTTLLRSALLALALACVSPGALADDFGGTSSSQNPSPPPAPPPCDDDKGCSCPSGPDDRSGSPISYFNGGESISEQDLLVEGAFAIAITRQYDSQSTFDSPLGYGWSLTYDRRLYEYPDGSVLVRHGCGLRDRYVPAGGGYASPAGGMLATLLALSGGVWQLRYASGESDFFDSQGRLTALQDKRGSRLEFTYDSRGKLPLIGTSKDAIDASLPMVLEYVFRITRIDERAMDGALTGHYVTFSYDENTGRLDSVVAHDGRTVTYTHDVTGTATKGNLTGVAGIGGIQRTYTYADPLDPHNLTSIVDAPGRTAVVNTYDDQDRVIRQEEGPRKIEFNYQVPLARTVVTKTIRDQNGLNPYTSATTYDFDASGRITKIVDPFGNENRYIYNANRQLERKEIWQKNGATLALLLARNWTYDAAGHRQSELVTLDSGESITRTWTYTGNWIASEQVVSSAAPSTIFRTEFTFNFGPDGQPATIQSVKRRRDDGSFQTTSYTYDAQNRMLTSTLPDGVVKVNEYAGDDLTRTFLEVGGVEIAQMERRFEYDTRGLLIKRWDARDNLTQFSYDDRGRLTSVVDPLGQEQHHTYDGDLLTQVEAGRTIADGEGQVTRFLHDTMGRRTTVQRKNDSGTYVSFQTVAYDSEGRVLTSTDAVGRVTRFAYDLEGRVASITDPSNQVTQYFYDAAGRRVRTVAPLGREFELEYDDMGRETARIQKGVTPSPRAEFSYDATGNRTQVLDAEGHATNYTYDALSRLTSITRPLGQVTQLTYDSRDRVDTVVNARGQKLDFDFETWGPPKQQRYFASASATTPLRTIAIDRDDDGNVTAVTDDGVQGTPMVTYSNDALGRALDETVRYIPGGDRVLQRRYDRFGNTRELTLVDGSNFVNTYTRNKLNEVTVASLSGNSVAATYLADSQVDVQTLSGTVTRDFGYDNRGMVNSIASAGSSGQIAQLSYVYDNAGRVDTFSDASGTHDATYNGIDRLTGFTHPAASGLPLTESFAYDGVGNREDPANAALFQYDANNRVTASPGLTYTADADGNIATTSGGATFTHDLLNRLSDFAATGISASYLYDIGSRRIRKTVGSQSSWYLWDGSRLAAEYNGTGVRVARYSYLPGSATPSLFADANGTYWSHPDRLGAVRMLTTNTGVVVWRAQYSAYGQAVIDADPDGNSQTITFPLRLPGQYADAESGLYYNVSRYYYAPLGRYLEEDRLPSANQYWYAEGDPLSLIDPLGLTAIFKWPPNNYSDIPPPPGTPCLVAIYKNNQLSGWKPCDECPAGGGDGDGMPGPYDYNYDGWPTGPGGGNGGGDNDDGDDDGDGAGDSDSNGDQGQEDKRDSCFGSGEFLGDIRYWERVAPIPVKHWLEDELLDVTDHAARAPVVTRWVIGPIKRVLGPMAVYEGLIGAPRETCEDMYPD
jgi:RHS repeat-associated protein